MSTEYSIYLVPNGSRRDFLGHNFANTPFADSKCTLLGVYDNMEDVKVRFRELATECFCSEEGEWDRIWCESMDFDAVTDAEDEARRREEADRIAQSALDKFVADRIDTLTIDWGDLQRVHVAKCDEDGNILEVL